MSEHIPRLGVAVRLKDDPERIGIVCAVLDEDRDLWSVYWDHNVSSGQFGSGLAIAEPASEEEIRKLAQQYVDRPVRDMLWMLDLLAARDERMYATDFIDALRDVALGIAPPGEGGSDV